MVGCGQDSYYIHDERPTDAPPNPADQPPECPFATCLIYLDETDVGAAATHVSKGSHRGQAGLNGGLYSEETARGAYDGRIDDKFVGNIEAPPMDVSHSRRNLFAQDARR